MQNISNWLIKYPLFLGLLPIFFVLHGFTENFSLIKPTDATLLLLTYFLATGILVLLCRLLFRNWVKAMLMAAFLMAIQFFFGGVHDALRNSFPGTFISKYSFVLPLILIMISTVYILLRRRRNSFQRLFLYLNILFILLIVIDISVLSGKAIKINKSGLAALPTGMTNCQNCPSPDVFVIITDEYAGEFELNEVFQFDNSPFYLELEKRKFHRVRQSSSNYNFTPYSIASTLDMNYLGDSTMGGRTSLIETYKTIRSNRLLNFLQQHNYKFYNYSSFDFDGQPALTRETFLPVSTKLISGQTLLSRMEKEMRYHLVTTLKSKNELKKYVYYNRNNNEKLYDLTKTMAATKLNQPKFVLTHLMLPHYPYYYDKNGKEFPLETLVEGQQVNQRNYIEYLQYANREIIALIDHILASSASLPVIILMGDHGFRHFENPVDPRNIFSNLVAVHLPGDNYAAFGDSLTNVNLMRAFLNTSFGQRLPYLKDTTIIMDNP